jgi:hypothetical protein
MPEKTQEIFAELLDKADGKRRWGVTVTSYDPVEFDRHSVFPY